VALPSPLLAFSLVGTHRMGDIHQASMITMCS
jgi:hypothetical protein